MNVPNEYLQSTLYRKLKEQKKKYNLARPICLFCDLDDSYLLKYWPSEEVLSTQTQKYTDTVLSPHLELYTPTIILKKYLDENQIPLIIVTGRDIHQMNELIASFHSKLPMHREIMDVDGIVGGVGTEVHLKMINGPFHVDAQYESLLSSTGFRRGDLLKILTPLIPRMLAQFHPQEFDFSKRDKHDSIDELPKQPHKISLESKCDDQTALAILAVIRKTLDEAQYTAIKILLSCPYKINKTINKYNFDIVPYSKEKPIQFLKDLFGVEAIVAGDSGNDFEMIMHAADIGIVVGNAKKELLDSFASVTEETKRHIMFAPKNVGGPTAILEILKKIYPNNCK